VSDYYDSLSPTPEDIGCLLVLEIASQIPTPEPDVLHAVALEVGEQKAKAAVSLAEELQDSCQQGRDGVTTPYPIY